MENSAINLEPLSNSLNGDTTILIELVDMFLNSAPEMLLEIRKAIEGGEVEAMIRAAHKLKGAASNFGADKVVLIAHEIEMMHQNYIEGDALPAFEKLSAALNMVLSALQDTRNATAITPETLTGR